MNPKETNLRIVEEIKFLLSQMEIESNGHEQGFIFIFGQNTGENIGMDFAAAGCPNCTLPTLIMATMRNNADFADAIPKAMVRFVQSKFNEDDGLTLRKEQGN